AVHIANSAGWVFAGGDLCTAFVHGLASFGGFVIFHPVVVVAAAIGAVGAVAVLRRRTPPTDWDLWLWVASGVAAWAAGVRFFGHYWLQALPPLVLLAVAVVIRWTRRANSP